MISPVRFTKSLTVLLVGFILSSCAPSPVLNLHESVSRTTMTLCFSTRQQPYKINSIVGGEHITTYRILGFPEEELLVEVDSIEPEALYFNVKGHQAEIIESIRSASKQQFTVRFLATTSEAILQLSAHPHASYHLAFHPVTSNN